MIYLLKYTWTVSFCFISWKLEIFPKKLQTRREIRSFPFKFVTRKMQFKIFEIWAFFSNSSVKQDPSESPFSIHSVLSKLIAEFNGLRKIIITRKTIILTNAITAHEIVIKFEREYIFLIPYLHTFIHTYIYWPHPHLGLFGEQIGLQN